MAVCESYLLVTVKPLTQGSVILWVQPGFDQTCQGQSAGRTEDMCWTHMSTVILYIY